MAFAPLVKEYRGNTLDLTHFGYLTIVDENSKVLYSVGDPDDIVYYRSASKPIQALPVIARGLDKKFGLTDEESTIFAGSHAGEAFHIAALESIFEKCDMKEETLCMKPAVPAYAPANEQRVREGLPPRKFYHNCAGKHAALMLLQRDLGGDIADYWKMGSVGQLEVQRTIEIMSETKHVELGIDGCGVPVFAVPVRCIANAFKNLVAPEHVQDAALQQAVVDFVPRIHKYPHMMRGTNYLCSLINCDPNIVGKGGANGVYGFALKKEKIGVSFKFADGTEHLWPLMVLEVLKGLGALSRETEERLRIFHAYTVHNDNDNLVGENKPCFEVKI